MKLWLTLAGIALLAIVSAVLLPRTRSEAQPERDDKKPPARTVTASGTGSVKTTADVMRINVNVKSVAASSQEAADENEKKVKKLDAAVQALQIPKLTTAVLPAGSYKVAPPPHPPGGMNPMGGPPMPPAKPAADSYSAAHTLQIVVKNDDPGKLIDAAERVAKALRANGLLDLGMNYSTSNFAGPSGGLQLGGQIGGQIGGIQGFQGGFQGGFQTGASDNTASVVFAHEETIELRRKALTKAVEAAMGNARAMSDGAKLRLVEVTSVSDQTNFGPSAGPLNVTANHPTDIEITVDVTVIVSVKD
jgi:uncharacterized protein YggE